MITGNEPVHTVFFLIADYLPEIPVSSGARIYIPEIRAFNAFALFFCSTINCFSFDLALANVMYHPIDSESLSESENRLKIPYIFSGFSSSIPEIAHFVFLVNSISCWELQLHTVHIFISFESSLPAFISRLIALVFSINVEI